MDRDNRPIVAYDVLQVDRQGDGRWLDYSTLRTAEEFAIAENMVSSNPMYRVVNMTKTTIIRG